MGDLEVGAHLNGDESMAQGTVFFATNFSSSFQSKKIYGNDGYNFDIRVELKNLNADSEALEKGTVLFPTKTKFGSKKTLSFKYNDDIEATFYADIDGKGEKVVTKFNITDFATIKEDAKYKDLETPKLSLVFKLNNLGLIELTKVRM